MTALTLDRPSAWKLQPQSIDGKRVLLTGGTTGIGRTTVQLLAYHGAHVVTFGRDKQHARDAQADFVDLRGRVEVMTADVVNEMDLDRVFNQVRSTLGGLDILINNAAIAAGTIAEEDAVDYRYELSTNIGGYLAVARRAIPLLKDGGGGTIINVGSLSAKARSKGGDIYVATKSAIRGWSDSLAKQLEADKIRVTLIEPGLVGADIHQGEQAKPPKQRELEAQGKMLFSEAIAEAVFYVLTQPPDCFVPMLQIQPIHQKL